MEPGHHPADDQQPGVVVQLPLSQLRRRYPGLHDDRAGDNDTADGEAKPPVEGHVQPTARVKEGAGAPLQRPPEAVFGDHESLQRTWREPHRLPGANVHSVSHLDRAIPVN